ncbi:MAG TPA: class I SAM-dependent methyltransferase [Gammaproteobacteria bacterium]|jgi:2-polyprenyl-6-hydroxyphenyl methylase/3-demethylubiquinone-9 3-methyltransferase|nr:class I SAM-dependent methyltransferase [Gammaproteobacteria bacterium]
MKQESEIRFEFGTNWQHFLSVLNDERLEAARLSMVKMLECDDLHNKSFLDIGSGSGLSSLVARRMGARVHSFDYDPQSVACTAELKRRYCSDDPDWTIERGSVLDEEYLARLGSFDIVYSWGVLHHTGAMYEALENVVPLVAMDGRLFISLYNDQRRISQLWTWVKKTYVTLPKPVRFLLEIPSLTVVWGPNIIRNLLTRFDPFHDWREYHTARGMSPWYDLIDWVGGYPFEVSRPDEIFRFFHERGFSLENLYTCGGGKGCNEYVFSRRPAPD